MLEARGSTVARPWDEMRVAPFFQCPVWVDCGHWLQAENQPSAPCPAKRTFRASMTSGDETLPNRCLSDYSGQVVFNIALEVPSNWDGEAGLPGLRLHVVIPEPSTGGASGEMP